MYVFRCKSARNMEKGKLVIWRGIKFEDGFQGVDLSFPPWNTLNGRLAQGIPRWRLLA